MAPCRKYLNHSTWLLLFSSVVASVPRHDATTDPLTDADLFRVNIYSDGLYTISVKDVTWLFSSPTFFNADGATYTAFETLKLNSTTVSSGTDAFGRFQVVTFQYFAGHNEITAAIRTYKEQPFAIFTQRYVSGANNTRAYNVDYSISGFPSFSVTDVQTYWGPLGYLAFGGIMCGDTDKQLGIFSQEDFKATTGLAGGPIALFDGSGDTLIISPASNFMAASSWHSHFFKNVNFLQYGIMGGVNTVPAGTLVDFIVYYSSKGVNQAFEGWGSYLQKVYKRTDHFVRKDLTINYLGYWTDAGAYYYYNTEVNKTYEETMLDAKAYADHAKIPYRYWQYDSWWYYKGVDEGVKTWEARPDIFPDGFQYLYDKMGRLPACAHNRFWSSDTTYAKQNGGSYNFIVEPLVSLPIDQRFWDELFANASAWGLYSYLQDWQSKQFYESEALLSDLSLGATWLNQMANSASKHHLTVQYCMSYSRNVMQALVNSVVTQVRVSKDYFPGNDQWKIGVTSIFAYAMGIAPFKDNFWSTTNQPFSPYNHTEPYPELQAAVSVFSAGPVGPCDMIDHTNVSLLMRCCNAEGLILKPSKPATAVDDQIYHQALGAAHGADGEVWSTYSTISDLTFGIIFVPKIKGHYNITPREAGFAPVSQSLMVFEVHDVHKVAAFSEETPLVISGCSLSRPCIYHSTPVLKHSPTVFLLGELDKFVPMSPQRVTSIDVDDDVIVHLQGVAEERVSFTFFLDSELQTVTCVFGPSRAAELHLISRTCQ